MLIVVNSVYSANNVNAGKIAGSEQRSVVDAGIYSHSGGAVAVPVMKFGKSCNSKADVPGSPGWVTVLRGALTCPVCALPG